MSFRLKCLLVVLPIEVLACEAKQRDIERSSNPDASTSAGDGGSATRADAAATTPAASSSNVEPADAAPDASASRSVDGSPSTPRDAEITCGSGERQRAADCDAGDTGPAVSVADADADGIPDATAPCGTDQYWNQEQLLCSAIQACAAGERIGVEATPDADRSCIPCEDGTFSGSENSPLCTGCRSCGWLGLEASCTKSHDAICRTADAVKTFGDIDNWAYVTALAVGGLGELWVGGYTSGDIHAPNQGFWDAYVRHYPPNGSNPTGAQFGTAGDDRVKALAVDGSGEVWALAEVAVGASGSDIVLNRHSEDGSYSLADSFGSNDIDVAAGVAIDALGDVWMAGSTNGDLGGPKLGSYYDNDAFVRRYSRDAADTFTDKFGTASTDLSSAIASDSLGNVWVAGHTLGALDGPNLGGYDAFVRKYPVNDSAPVTFQFGSAGDDLTTALVFDLSDNLWVAGTTGGDLAGTNLGGTDAFLRLYPADGTQPVTYQFGTAFDDEAVALAVDPTGAVWVAGNTAGDLGGTGAGRGFVRRYPPDGTDAPVSYQFGTSDVGYTTYTTSLAIDHWGNLWVGGYDYYYECCDHEGDTFTSFVRQVAYSVEMTK